MKLLPRSLFGQVVFATVVAVVVSQLIGVWLLLAERARLADHLWSDQAAERVAGFISALDEAGSAERLRIIGTTGLRPSHASLEEPWRKPGENPPAEAISFLAKLRKELPRPLALQMLVMEPDWPPTLPDARPVVAPAGAGVLDDPRRRRLRLVAVQARLTDGSVLTLRHVLPPTLAQPPTHVLVGVALLVAIVGALTAWTVRRLTRPLGTLARAASGLASNLDQPALVVAGPAEVATAAASFNRMQQDLKRNLETRSQALAAVSHDLRLPITRIRLRIERLTDEATREAIESDLVEMDRMIGDTLEFLRAGHSGEQPARIDVNALVESVAEDMRALGCSIETHGEASAPLLARGQAMRRCLGNLVDNARRYGGGAVDLTVRDETDQLEFVVEDRGPGIPESERERVFEPYVRLETSRARHTGGSGLGLAIARAIARGHGGDVALESREGGGLRAVLRFPRRPGRPLGAPAAAPLGARA
ncbi:MAG TPA: ATP-binding protein [Burkholderiaceae bacterium]|nr:ATP-binding protein [Burkholderiaceae bacterium]